MSVNKTKTGGAQKNTCSTGRKLQMFILGLNGSSTKRADLCCNKYTQTKAQWDPRVKTKLELFVVFFLFRLQIWVSVDWRSDHWFLRIPTTTYPFAQRFSVDRLLYYLSPSYEFFFGGCLECKFFCFYFSIFPGSAKGWKGVQNCLHGCEEDNVRAPPWWLVECPFLLRTS